MIVLITLEIVDQITQGLAVRFCESRFRGTWFKNLPFWQTKRFRWRRFHPHITRLKFKQIENQNLMIFSF